MDVDIAANGGRGNSTLIANPGKRSDSTGMPLKLLENILVSLHVPDLDEPVDCPGRYVLRLAGELQAINGGGFLSDGVEVELEQLVLFVLVRRTEFDAGILSAAGDHLICPYLNIYSCGCTRRSL